MAERRGGSNPCLAYESWSSPEESASPLQRSVNRSALNFDWSVRYTTEDDEVVKKSLAQVGVAYYYNLETSVAQWTCPEGFTPAETAASAASARS